MAKEVFNRNASHKNIGEIETKNNTIGSVIGFMDSVLLVLSCHRDI